MTSPRARPRRGVPGARNGPPCGGGAEPNASSSLPAQLIVRLRAGGVAIPAERLDALERLAADPEWVAPRAGALAEGAAVEPFELPNAVGTPVRSAEMLRRGPLLLVFHRGAWCWAGERQLLALERAVPLAEAEGASVAALSPLVPLRALADAERLRISFECLSDVGGVVARRFGLVRPAPPELRWAIRRIGIDLRALYGMRPVALVTPAGCVITEDGRLARVLVRPAGLRPGDLAELAEALRRGRAEAGPG